jgi:altronate dehydratase
MVLPTSVCSGQIAALIANKLNDQLQHEYESTRFLLIFQKTDVPFSNSAKLQGKVSRFVALPHTEGCGASGGDSESIFSRTLIGYLLHPTVKVREMKESDTRGNVLKSCLACGSA